MNLAPQRWRGAGVRISTTATGRDAQPHRSRSLTYREPHARTASAKFGIHGRSGRERAASMCGEMRGMAVSSPRARQPFCSSSSAPSGSTPPPINDKVHAATNSVTVTAAVSVLSPALVVQALPRTGSFLCNHWSINFVITKCFN